MKKLALMYVSAVDAALSNINITAEDALWFVIAILELLILAPIFPFFLVYAALLKLGHKIRSKQ